MVKEIDIENINSHIIAFPSVVGQEKIREDFSRALKNGRLAHSYIFSGNEGTGRNAMTIELARVLNCEYPLEQTIYDDCKCKNCTNIRKWNHPNLIPVIPMPKKDKVKDDVWQSIIEEFIKIKSNDVYAEFKSTGSGNILVESIRNLRNRLSLVPDLVGYRVVVIQPASQMNIEAANALLKLLEEPPQRCILILITDTTRSLLPTILSRCQIIKFPPLKTLDVERELTVRKAIPPESAKRIARLSFGSLSRAVAVLEENLLSDMEMSLDFLRASVTGNASKINSISEEVVKFDRQGQKRFYRCIQLWIMDAIIWKTHSDDEAEEKVYNFSNLDVVKKMSERYSLWQLEQSLRQIAEAILEIDANVLQNISVVSLAIRLKGIFR